MPYNAGDFWTVAEQRGGEEFAAVDTPVLPCCNKKEIVPMPCFLRPLTIALLGSTLFCEAPVLVEAQSPPASSATTEQSCSFGMGKGDPTHQCQVPIPAGCVVAHFPGTKKPWTTVSKAGRTFCKFEEKSTDWKTRITGQCTRCDSNQCTGQFMVRFDCSKP
jgi:hypothetical protein